MGLDFDVKDQSYTLVKVVKAHFIPELLWWEKWPVCSSLSSGHSMDGWGFTRKEIDASGWNSLGGSIRAKGVMFAQLTWQILWTQTRWSDTKAEGFLLNWPSRTDWWCSPGKDRPKAKADGCWEEGLEEAAWSLVKESLSASLLQVTDEIVTLSSETSFPRCSYV